MQAFLWRLGPIVTDECMCNVSRDNFSMCLQRDVALRRANALAVSVPGRMLSYRLYRLVYCVSFSAGHSDKSLFQQCSTNWTDFVLVDRQHFSYQCDGCGVPRRRKRNLELCFCLASICDVDHCIIFAARATVRIYCHYTELQQKFNFGCIQQNDRY